ncbi:YfhO family protein [Alicyclobacillus cycloheptanicus]|uniref:Membrane protein YfhO n=1 Tax=Alicyclobacillus cycloheptanicus TaxID=1457 RepID=A0ABT9XP67_9BACL|nr:YfhO family protein [Alicyclobacillus cycloheptanicus]MDQ0191553.1 hypothetical protein [Alicyclobacillus cycloheptanicus]WDM00125.1 YfhO family protein [Alicyclobacillus cycloheptanicus]
MRLHTSAFAARVRQCLARHGYTWILLAAATAIAYPTWLSPQPMSLDDLGQLNGPQRSLLAWFYQHGHLPLWNPFSFGGQPFLAAGQSGPLYLPNIVFLLLPIAPAMKVSYLFHELLAAFGMYAVLWHFTKRRLASFTGAITFVTCGFLLGHQIHTQMFDAFSWLPVCFWLVLRVLSRPTLTRVCALSAGFAMEVYAGHPQVTFFVCLLLGLYTALYWLWHRSRRAAAGVLHVVCGFVLGVGLSAAQWLPTLQLASYSDRAAANASFLLQGSLPFSGLAQLLSPFTAGGGYSGTPFSPEVFQALYGINVYWEFTCYAGVIGLTLATAVMVSEFRRHHAVRSFSILTGFTVLLALGANTLAYVLLVDLPGFDLFRIPARYIGLTDFLIAVLTGVAIGRLERYDSLRLRRWVARIALGYALICIVLRLFGPLRTAPAVAFDVPVSLLVLTAVVCLIPWRAGGLRLRRVTVRPAAVVLASLVTVDVVSQAAGLSTLVLAPTAPYVNEDPSVAFLNQALRSIPDNPYPFARALSLDQTPVSQDRTLSERIPVLNGEDSLVPAWYTANINVTWDDLTLLAQPDVQAILDNMDVAYVVTAPDDEEAADNFLYPNGWEVVYRSNEAWIWKNPDRLRASWVAPSVNHVTAHTADTTRLVSWTPNRQVWQVSGPAAGWFVLSQTYDPNWVATVTARGTGQGTSGRGASGQGTPETAPVRRVAGVLTAVRIPSGSTTIVLQYQPKAFRAGCWVTIAAIVLLCVWLGWAWLNKPMTKQGS